MYKLYLGHWERFREYEEQRDWETYGPSAFRVLRISIEMPLFSHVRGLAYIPELAPYGCPDKASYIERLEKVGITRIDEIFRYLYLGKELPMVLNAFEHEEFPGYFAEWWQANTGHGVPEIIYRGWLTFSKNPSIKLTET